MNEETLFELALNTPEAELSAMLDRECAGNPALRARVNALLAAHADRKILVEQTIDHAGTQDFDNGTRPNHDAEGTHTFGEQTERTATPGSSIGTVIAGRYMLVEVIGEGGMGSVYLATQTEPVKRQVALKLIKAGMDSKGVLARFNAERQALAMMDHPNIARIYDGGVTPSGQPFFVMELVQGVPLTKYCDSKRLTVDARLQLFVSVCQAVQHAHQKGIIHRDLKPGNVLVTEVDGRPTPKVIDFGVAKATELQLTDQSFSDTGAIVGTPSYMSPEQADPTSMDIDTRTDVYALGVMLYELLTGSPPIDSKQFKRGAILEMLRMVREVEPPRPSAKLSTADALPNIAARRSIEPAKLAKLLQGELDWVVMKALEKDRTRRYETANGLARDIQRYLADEVVEARPPSRGYRLKKFVKRNKGQVIAASLVLLALFAGIVGTSIGLVQAEKRRVEADDARADETKQRVVAEENFKAATTAKEKEEIARKKADAERIIRESQGAIVMNALYTTSLYVDNVMKQKQSLLPLRLQIQSLTLRDIEAVRKHMAENPLPGTTEAVAFNRMGQIYELMNRIEDSRSEYVKCENLLIRVLNEDPSKPINVRNLAAVNSALGDVEILLGDAMAARDRFAKALTLRQQWVNMLGASTKEKDRKAIPVATLSIAESHNSLGRVNLELGDPVEAIQNFQDSDATYGRLPPIGNPNEQLKDRRDRLEVRDQIANCLYRLGLSDAAEKTHLTVLKDREALLATYPDPAYNLQNDVGFSHMRLGDFYLFNQKDALRALKRYQPLYEVSQARAKADPDDLAAKRQLTALQYRVAEVIDRIADTFPIAQAMALHSMATTQFLDCLNLRRELAVIDRKNTRAQIDVLMVLGRLGRSAEASSVATRLLTQFPNDRRVLFQSACGLARASINNSPAAERCRARAFEVLGDLVKKGWKDRVALETDPDLDAIRGDKKFADLLSLIPMPKVANVALIDITPLVAFVPAVAVDPKVALATNEENQKKIIGRWISIQPTDAGVLNGSTVEFTNDNKVTISLRLNGKEIKKVGTYKIEVGKIITQLKTLDGKEEEDIATIKSLSDFVLMLVDKKGIQTTFTLMKKNQK